MDETTTPRTGGSPAPAFADGMRRIWLHKRIILWLYLVNLAFAAVLVYPLRRVFDEINRSDLADAFVHGFSTDALADIQTHFGPQFNTIGRTAVGLGVLYLLANIFLTGGIVATLTLDHRVSIQRFLANAARYFGRFLRLFLLLAVAGVGVAAGYQFRIAPYLDQRANLATTDRADFLWRAVGIVLLLVVASLTLMVFDYARVRTVVERRRSMIAAAFRGLTFSVRRFWRCVRLFYLNALLVAAIAAVYLFVARQFASATIGSIAGLFVVQQLLIISRIWMRVSFFSSQLALFEACAASKPLETTAPPRQQTPSRFRPLDA